MTDEYDALFGDEPTEPTAAGSPQWPDSAPTVAMAAFLGVSERTLTGLRSKGVLVDAGRGRWPVQETVQKYVIYLRDLGTRRGGDKVAAEKLRLTKEQADKAALHNAITRGEMVPVADVRREWTTLAADLRAVLLTIPARVASQAALSREAAVELESELRAALMELGDAT
ncbi:MAG: hypothetical protein DI568_13735 [Sphingomonas sp.]|nr:MAG: hypothetical protein DI568_13735 [Sphingomonas sp.]